MGVVVIAPCPMMRFIKSPPNHPSGLTNSGLEIFQSSNNSLSGITPSFSNGRSILDKELKPSSFEYSCNIASESVLPNVLQIFKAISQK